MSLENIRPNQNPLFRTNRNESDPDLEKSLTPVVMGDIHARIHEGIFYTTSKVLLAVADNGFLDILIRVATECHLRPFLAAGGEASFALHEGTTFSADGTALLAVNRNRESSNVASTLFFHTPTVTTLEDLLEEGLQPGGSGGNAAGGRGEAGFEEWILMPGDHLFRIKNLGGAAKNLSVQLDFYEPHG